MKKTFHYIRLILFPIVGGFITTYFVCPACTESASNFSRVSIFSSIIWFILWFGNKYIAVTLDQHISWTETPAKRFVWALLSSVSFTLGTLYLLMFVYNWVTDFDITIDSKTIYYSIIITLALSAFFYGKDFLHNWRKAALDAAVYKKEMAWAQYEALRSQLNPHFLFNSLNVLTNIVYEDPAKAARFIKQLSEVYRYVLDTREKELVLLEEELHFVNSYLYLQQIRFGNNLKVHIDLPNENGQVAPLALQLLLENAIKHNIISLEDPLSIRIFQDNHYLCVANNLQIKHSVNQDNSGLGLENIRERYRFLTPDKVIVEKTNDTFTVKLPIIPYKI
ncbi:MAG: histidine kinase [Bacteroidetes bacterium]|nr:histidine kinase [Bacteroidota bacterium]